MATALFVYGTLRDDDDSGAPWTKPFVEGATSVAARVRGMLLMQEEGLTYPYAIRSGNDATEIVGRLLTFGSAEAFAAKLKEADEIEGYTGTDAGMYDRMVVEAHVKDAPAPIPAYIYFQRNLGPKPRVIPTGDWLQRKEVISKWRTYFKTHSITLPGTGSHENGKNNNSSSSKKTKACMDIRSEEEEGGESSDAAACGGAGGVDEDMALAMAIAAANDDDGGAGISVHPLDTCPHVGQGMAGLCHDVNRPCDLCANVGENMQCLTCGDVYCGRYIKAHMLAHHEASNHPIVVGFADLTFWCYECGNYITPYNPILFPQYSQLHLSKFGEAPPAPRSAMELR